MRVLQRFVTDPETAARMFPPGYGGGFYGPASPAAPTITFLVGPITCETCDGTGEHFIDLMTQIPGPCLDCLGRGYPARIEIVSPNEPPIGQRLQDMPTDSKRSAEAIQAVLSAARTMIGDVTVRGVVALGKPIPVVSSYCIDRTNEPQRAHVHVTGDGDNEEAGLCREDRDLIWDSPWHTRNVITDRLSGPVKPGDTVHPIEVVT